MEIPIIYEDDNLLAISKPAGLLVHPITKSKIKSQKSKIREFTLIDWLTQRYPEIKTVGDDPELRPGIVHRLDRDTSGILLIAKNQPYFEYLKNLFQKREIKKTYLVLVWGHLKNERGVINRPIGIKSGTVKRTVFGGKKIQPAETYYRLLKKIGDFSLLEVWPKTGRTHQIRVHLAAIGHPIVGDPIYGRKKINAALPDLKRQFLHAYSLEFNLAPGKRIRLAANLPEELREILRELTVVNQEL